MKRSEITTILNEIFAPSRMVESPDNSELTNILQDFPPGYRSEHQAMRDLETINQILKDKGKSSGAIIRFLSVPESELRAVFISKLGSDAPTIFYDFYKEKFLISTLETYYPLNYDGIKEMIDSWNEIPISIPDVEKKFRVAVKMMQNSGFINASVKSKKLDQVKYVDLRNPALPTILWDWDGHKFYFTSLKDYSA